MTHPWRPFQFPFGMHPWDEIGAPLHWPGPPQSPPLPDVSPYDYPNYREYQEALEDGHRRRAAEAGEHAHRMASAHAEHQTLQARFLLLLGG